MTLATTTRRRFIQLLPLSGLATLAACSKVSEPAPASPSSQPVTPAPTAGPAAAAPTTAAEAPMVDESDATAASLGYVAVASRVDSGRFPAYVAGSQCNNCALYQGTAGSAAGGCPLFVGRRVAAEGWCSAWAKRA